jgi:hypothetical protein
MDCILNYLGFDKFKPSSSFKANILFILVFNLGLVFTSWGSDLNPSPNNGSMQSEEYVSSGKGGKFKYSLRGSSGSGLGSVDLPIVSQGIVSGLLEKPKPLNLFNPYAPSDYGYGRDMVSWDSKDGKPKGFIVYGLRFW